MYLPNPLQGQNETQGNFFKQVLTCCYIKVKELSLSYYLPITERRIVECIHFPRVLTLGAMQTSLSRI